MKAAVAKSAFVAAAIGFVGNGLPVWAETPLPPSQVRADLAEMLNGDGLHVVLCGTSSPLTDPNRANACAAVIAGPDIYIIDTGPDSWEVVARTGLPGAQISAIFLTHFHSDHIGALGEFRMNTMVAGRNEMLPVYGPVGVSRVVEGFNAAYAIDAKYRFEHHGVEVIDVEAAPMVPHEFGSGFGAELDKEEVILERDGLKVTAFQVDHDPAHPAVGYRFDYKGRSVVIGGDTAKSANLVENAKGADILVCDSLSVPIIRFLQQSQSAVGNSRLAKILEDIQSYHASPIQCAEMANEAGVGLLLYTHHIPSAQVTNPVYMQGVSDVRPAETWRIGNDGTRVSLPVGTGEMAISEMLEAQ
ncbi:MAG: MBL fold metallo-hydrolase [Alphaproteobacteria bacterium]|nr:MBL fold metallo-hydrolase [Alphaproteobacteria bacterium]